MKKWNMILGIVTLVLTTMISIPMSAYAGDWEYTYDDKGFTESIRYKHDDGSYQIGWFFDEEAKLWSYFDPNGFMYFDWHEIDGKWYYFDLDNGGMWADRRTPDGSLLGADGTKIEDFNGKWYHVKSSGNYIFNPETDGGIYQTMGLNDANGKYIDILDGKILAALKGVCQITELNEYEKATYEVMKKIADSSDLASGSEYERAKKAYYCVVNNGDYNEGQRGLEDDTSYGLLIEGKGQCVAFSRTYKLFANLAGLNCRITGNSIHSWNEVEVDGEWKYVDTSLDDEVSSAADFFLKRIVVTCDGCKKSMGLPQGNYWICPCGIEFGNPWG